MVVIVSKKYKLASVNWETLICQLDRHFQAGPRCPGMPLAWVHFEEHRQFRFQLGLLLPTCGGTELLEPPNHIEDL